MVSEYECREVAKKANYTWSGWVELDPDLRAAEVAHYRIGLAIEAHVNDAYTKQAERNSRRNGSGRRR